MEFVSSSFPGTRIHLQLFELKGKTENVTSDEIDQRKQALAAIANTY